MGSSGWSATASRLGCTLGPYRGLFGPLLYLGTYGFNVCMTFMIGEYLLGCVDLFLLIPVGVLACTQVARASNRATRVDLERHCQFPPLAAGPSQATNVAQTDFATLAGLLMASVTAVAS